MVKSPVSRKAAPRPSAASKAAMKKSTKFSALSAPGKRAGAASLRLSKKAACLELLRQDEGASLQELMSATGWQAHSIRGFLSGTVKKKLGLPLASSGGQDDVRRYRIALEGE